ncbi:hypothetical protein BIFGAL_04317 [Bifidobacterium gallicum DSM 20093 = LMG 11596]|uniref:Uncharacterized protein n=1 Tax=Bifidobacterium gallicum DSM 20093 = LMG 11596 TaxID=561180 RepID=D1NWR2_9BIFI|nr:hypothetical protein BIFGAL_04317 [Bifidobacterium gallicum DSM 20093 = LMG 11596]
MCCVLIAHTRRQDRPVLFAFAFTTTPFRMNDAPLRHSIGNCLQSRPTALSIRGRLPRYCLQTVTLELGKHAYPRASQGCHCGKPSRRARLCG